MSTLVSMFASVAVAVSPAPPAVAQPRQAPAIRVVTRDLNLSSLKGRRMLTLRIFRAASQLCDLTNERFDAKVRVAQRQCRDEAMATALASVPNAVRQTARSSR